MVCFLPIDLPLVRSDHIDIAFSPSSRGGGNLFLESDVVDHHSPFFQNAFVAVNSDGDGC